MENKRGQGLSTNAIILIILGVVVLVILILGFTLGWKTLVPFIKQDNVATVIKSCETACSTQSTFDYCSKIVELKSDEDIQTSCYLLERVDNFSKYGLNQPCSINCDLACVDLSINGKAGTAPVLPATTIPNSYNVTLFTNDKKSCYIAA